jgi:hypothetical protein
MPDPKRYALAPGQYTLEEFTRAVEQLVSEVVADRDRWWNEYIAKRDLQWSVEAQRAIAAATGTAREQAAAH